MPSPHRPRLWTPRQSHSHYPRKIGWVLPPSKPYVRPPMPKFSSARQTSAAIHAPEEGAAELRALGADWAKTASKLAAKFAHSDDPDEFPRQRAEAAMLEKQAALAAKAAHAIEASEQAVLELKELKASTADDTGAKLGQLLHKRRIKIGEIIGQWSKSRDPAHRGEVSRAEFHTEVVRLGLEASGHQIGALFDRIDTDSSGWLDVEEAKVAIKALHTAAVQSMRQSPQAQSKTCARPCHGRQCRVAACARCLP